MKKCAVFNDLSGFGKCSLMAAIPIISSMGLEVHPVPTAVLTKQTGYDRYSLQDLTDFMPCFLQDWTGEQFDGILTGFISNAAQGEHIAAFIDRFRQKNTLLLVDPVMADDGVLYDGFDAARCQAICRLAETADIITPNLTELSILTNSDYTEDYTSVCSMAAHLAQKNQQCVVVTGFRHRNTMHTLVFSATGKTDIEAPLYDGSFSGTGDVFASVLMGSVLTGQSVEAATKAAVDFIDKSICATSDTDRRAGIAFEKYLGEYI